MFMQKKSKKSLSTPEILSGKGIVSNEVQDYSNDPFVLRKAEIAKKRIERVGFPKQWLEERKSSL
jgi:hypothetical protein